MNRRRAVLHCIAACTILTSCASAQGLPTLGAKVDAVVVKQLESGKSVEVLVRLAAKPLQDQILKETDAIYADPSTDEKEKKARNDAAYERHRQRLSRLKASVFPSRGIPGVKVIGDVSFGPEVVAIVSSLQALAELTSNPLVEHVFVNGVVGFN